MRRTALLLVMLLVPASADAQEVATSFAELTRQQVLKEGDTIWVVFDFVGAGEYEEIKAKLVNVADTAITVQVDSLPSGTTNLKINSSNRRPLIEIPENRLRRIEHQRRDSLWKGAIIGTAVGVGLGTLVSGECESQGACIFYGTIFWAGIGAGIDALIKPPPEVVYLGSDASGCLSSRMTLSLSPVVSKDRKGALFTVTW